MKVFFSTSVSRQRNLLPVTKSIVKIIEELGHEVLTKELVEPTYANKINWQNDHDANEIYHSAIDRLEKADVLITECTTPSFGAGFFIDKALEMGKPQLCLHWGDFYSNATFMLQGRKDEINLQMYTDENIKEKINKFFSSLESDN